MSDTQSLLQAATSQHTTCFSAARCSCVRSGSACEINRLAAPTFICVLGLCAASQAAVAASCTLASYNLSRACRWLQNQIAWTGRIVLT